MNANLARALEQGDIEAVVDWLVGSTPAERTEVREKLFSGIPVHWRLQQLGGAHNVGLLLLAQLAVGRWGDVKRLRVWFDPALAMAALRVLTAVRPTWLSKWVAERVGDDFGLDWGILRPLVRDGFADRPPASGYLRSLARFLEHTPAGEVLAMMHADPGMLDDFWQLFDVDFGGFHLYGDEPHPAGIARALIAGGLVERSRMVEAPVRALAAGTDRKAVAGLVAFHAGLAPTAAEWAALQPLLVDLLRSPDGPTVGFALAALAKIDKQGALDDRAFAEAVPRVFAQKPMNHPKAALALLDRVARRNADLAMEGLLAALDHPAPQVQERAVALLETHATGAARDRLRARLDRVVDSQRPRVAALAGAAPAEPARLRSPAPAEDGPPEWRLAARIDEVRAGELVPVRFGPFDVPRLDRSSPVAPIADPEELYDQLSLALHRVDGLAFERVLDGMARLAPRLERARLHPLWVRVEKEPFQSLLGREVARLIGAAVGQTLAPWAHRVPIMDRVDEAIDAVRDRRSAPRIALPSDRRGWLDPAVWAARLAQHTTRDLHDRVAALYRLAPEGRSEVLPLLTDPDLGPERYAVGGPAPGPEHPAPLRLAAARARDPLGDVSRVVRVEGSGGSGVARYALDLRTSTLGRAPVLAVHTEQVHRPGLSLVAAANGDTIETSWGWLLADVGYEVLAWPARPHGFLATAVTRLDERRDTASNAYSPVAPLVEPLFDPDLAWDEGDQLSLPLVVAALALTSIDPEARGRAVDATIAAIGDGRCADGALGRMFAILLAHDRLKLNRVATGLLEIARTGPLARWVCCDIAMALLASLTAPSSDLHHLLEASRELLAAAGRPLDPRCAELLAELPPRTKAGKLARELLRAGGSDDLTDAVLAEAVAGRAERVARWSAP